MANYYEVLGVKPDANQSEIRKRYRELVSLYHPDKHSNNPLRELAEQKMKEINEAYEVLGTPEKREEYDSGVHTERSYHYSDRASQNYDILIANATESYSQRLWGKTIEYCTQAIAIDSSRYEAFGIRGIAQSSQNNHSKAIEDLETAIRNGGQDDWIFAQLAFSYAELGNHAEAITYIKKAMQVGSREPNYLAFLAIQYEKLGSQTEASNTWNELRSVDPNNETLKQRDQVWKVGGAYVNKKDVGTTAAACATCILCDLLCNCC